MFRFYLLDKIQGGGILRRGLGEGIHIVFGDFFPIIKNWNFMKGLGNV